MNEVKKVHLGRQQFVISVEAHKALRDYLAAIEKQPGVQAEVVKEIEVRMAELLIEHGISGEKVVLPEDVDFLKQQLGEPRDFKDDTAAEEEKGPSAKAEEPAAEGPKKLYRDTEDAWLAGVASGLAAYTGIDVLLIRVAFIITTFAWGFGPVAYVIFWWLAPEAKTPSERLQMRGKAVTVDSLKEMVDRADIAGVSERAGRNIGRVLTRIVEGFVRIILGIVGVGIMLAGIAVTLWSTFVGSYLLIHNGQVGANFQFPTTTKETIFTGLSFGSLIIIGFFLLMIGIVMIWRKWRFPAWASVSLLGVLMVTASVGTALGFDIYPGVRDRYQQAHHTETRQLSAFNGLAVSGNDVTYKYVQDDKYFVELDYLGEHVDVKSVTTKVNDETLEVDTRNFKLKSFCALLCVNGDMPLTVLVHAPELSDIRFTGSDNEFWADSLLNEKQSTARVSLAPRQMNIIRVEQLNATNVEVSGNNPRELQINFKSTQPGFIGGRFSYDDDAKMKVRYALNELKLNDPKRCDLSEADYYLEDGSKTILFADKTVTGVQELQKLQSQDEMNAYNCVIIR